MKNNNKAAFFDRDGTLIHDVPYLSNLTEVSLLYETVAIARFLHSKGYMLFVVTNQSGVVRGLFDMHFVDTTHNYLGALLALQGVFIEQFYACPHHPTQATVAQYACDCHCRKPKPGMLQQAAQDYSIDLTTSLMFGNTACDLEAGQAAGCKAFDITKLHKLPFEECATLLTSL